MLEFLMYSEFILSNVIKLVFIVAGIAIIYNALKPQKKVHNYSVTISGNNLTKIDKEKLASEVLEGMKKEFNR